MSYFSVRSLRNTTLLHHYLKTKTYESTSELLRPQSRSCMNASQTQEWYHEYPIILYINYHIAVIIVAESEHSKSLSRYHLYSQTFRENYTRLACRSWTKFVFSFQITTQSHHRSHPCEEEGHGRYGEWQGTLFVRERSTLFLTDLTLQWISLEQAKHGMVHLRLTWLQLSKDPADLKAVSRTSFPHERLYVKVNWTLTLN